jgi:large subunit ribosomal protein L3
MGKTSRPRFGSLQFWPRKRVTKAIPSVNWSIVSSEGKGILGFIGYKVGMGSAIVKDETKDSMTKGKRITIPVTILEVPNMKVYSVRFYKDGKVMKDVVVSNERELKRRVKVPKELKKDLDSVKDFDDVRLIVYSLVKQTGLKKKPDLAELGIIAEYKLAFVKEVIGKEISFEDAAVKDLVDVRGLTKGKGLSGPVRRFGITLKQHKSEKGRRNPGSLAPWHPARVTFRTPMSGQLGMFTRVHYNLRVVDTGKVAEKDINKKEGFKHYGKVKTNYVVLSGSVQGPVKRQILVTSAMRPNKKGKKKSFELLELKL